MRRPTVHISARTLAYQHAGERDLPKHSASSPAAEHFMRPGALHVFVRRRDCTHVPILCIDHSGLALRADLQREGQTIGERHCIWVNLLSGNQSKFSLKVWFHFGPDIG